jgi:hypothetical protein
MKDFQVLEEASSTPEKTSNFSQRFLLSFLWPIFAFMVPDPDLKYRRNLKALPRKNDEELFLI